MEKQKWTRKKRVLAAGLVVVLPLAGFLSGMGIRKLFWKGEEVAVYSVEGLRDKKWSDMVTVSATVETGTLTAYYYDSRKPAAEFYITEGQMVEAGEPILRYDCTVMEAELSGVEKSLENQRIYLARLGSFIQRLKATKPLPDPDGFGRAGESLGGKILSVAAIPAEESLEGFVEAEKTGSQPVVYDRVDEHSVPGGGSGTTQDPYFYYVRKGGEVSPEVIAMLMDGRACGRFLIVEDEGSIQTPLFVWNFDGKVYGDLVQEESSSGESDSSVEESSSLPSETDIPESSPVPEETSFTPEETTPVPEETSLIPEETSFAPEETPSAPEETPSSSEGGEEPPDFEGDFDDGDLEEALGELESVPRGYTKEELAQMIGERNLEYGNLELAIRKKELQAEDLRKEIEENILVAKEDGQVRSVLSMEEAVRYGQPMVTIQGTGGFCLTGQWNEVLAAALEPGEKFSVSARIQGKERSFEAVLQSVDHKPKEAGKMGSMPVADMAAGGISEISSGPELSSMSYYGFSAVPVKAAGIRAGDTVQIIIPRSLFAPRVQEEKSDDTVVLPDELLFYENGEAFVYAMDGAGRLEKRQVETGRSFLGTETEILSGVTVGDYLAYPKEADGRSGATARIVYGEEMEIGTKEAEEEGQI